MVMIKGNYSEWKLEFFLVNPFGRQLSLNVTKCCPNDREGVGAGGWGSGRGCLSGDGNFGGS